MGIVTLLVQQAFSYFWGEAGPPESAGKLGLLFPILWVFFLLFHIGVLQLAKVSERRFIIYYMGLLGGKIFLVMLSVLLYGFFLPQGLKSFVAVLLPLYFLLTIIQVRETLVHLRNKETAGT